MDIVKLVADRLDEYVHDGKLEKLIDEKMGKMMEDVVGDMFSSYKGVGKIIKKELDESIPLVDFKIDLPAYSVFIAEVAKTQFDKVLREDCAERVSDLIKEKVPVTQKTAKFSDILNHVKEIWREEAMENRDDYIEYIEIDCDDSRDNTLFVTFKHPKYDWKNVKATIYMHDREGGLWNIGYIEEEGKQITGSYKYAATSVFNDVTCMLFRYWAMGTKFEADADFERIYLGY